MYKIIIIAQESCISTNLKDYLRVYLKVDILVGKDFTFLNGLSASQEDLIIIVNEDNQFGEEDINKLENRIIVLSDLKPNSLPLKKNIVVLNFPIFLPDLLYSIQGLINNSLNTKLLLSIPGYELIIDYGDTILKDLKSGENIKFTPSEGRLLKILFKKFPQPILKEEIMNLNNNNECATLDTHIFNIKNRLQLNKFSLTIIKNKLGYKLDIANENN